MATTLLQDPSACSIPLDTVHVGQSCLVARTLEGSPAVIAN